MQILLEQLNTHGYIDTIQYEKEGLHVLQKEVILMPDSLFFVDAAYRMMHTFLFALSAPKYETKGILKLELQEYHTLGMTGFSEKFNIEIEMSWDDVIIRRQYGMRKILPNAFDASRYVLRKGFPDFPSCPYGHTFKMLGYDIQTETYVRLASSILKYPDLQQIQYKDTNEKHSV